MRLDEVPRVVRVPQRVRILLCPDEQVHFPVPKEGALEITPPGHALFHKAVDHLIHAVPLRGVLRIGGLLLAKLLHDQGLGELAAGDLDVGVDPPLLEGLGGLVPGVRPEMHGREIDPFEPVIGDEILPRLGGPARRVHLIHGEEVADLVLLPRARVVLPREEALASHGDQVVWIQGLDEERHFLNPALERGLAVVDDPALAPRLVDEVPGEDRGVVPVQDAAVGVLPGQQRLHVGLVDRLGSLVGEEERVPLHFVLLPGLVE
mmetsp:Transcript_4467/g.10665  ORF Transcript_4467/g.10665 Transcript_4467/m.10665 type:complete len:263 (+) Transcript_4467:159-947(+)